MALRHENWHELAMFTRSLNDTLGEVSNEIKDAHKMLNPTITEAVRQFIIEVNDYGCYGISNMPAKEWFNDDGVRRPWGDAIAALYTKYQASLKEAESEKPNEVVESLKEMKDQVASLMAQVKALKEQGDMMKHEDMPPEDGEEKDKEEDKDKEDTAEGE